MQKETAYAGFRHRRADRDSPYGALSYVGGIATPPSTLPARHTGAIAHRPLYLHPCSASFGMAPLARVVGKFVIACLNARTGLIGKFRAPFPYAGSDRRWPNVEPSHAGHLLTVFSFHIATNAG